MPAIVHALLPLVNTHIRRERVPFTCHPAMTESMAQAFKSRKMLEAEKLHTLQGRLLAALKTVGVFSVPDLRRKWREAFREDLNRQTAHRWFNRSKPPTDIEYQFLFKLAELTNHAAIWIALGQGQPTRWRPISAEQAECLDIFDRLREERREKWMSLGRDSLAAQDFEHPTRANPYPHKTR